MDLLCAIIVGIGLIILISICYNQESIDSNIDNDSGPGGWV